jgi:hypothetical protein
MRIIISGVYQSLTRRRGPRETESLEVCVGRSPVKIGRCEYVLSIDYICCKKLKKNLWIFSKKIFEILIFYMKK